MKTHTALPIVTLIMLYNYTHLNSFFLYRYNYESCLVPSPLPSLSLCFKKNYNVCVQLSSVLSVPHQYDWKFVMCVCPHVSSFVLYASMLTIYSIYTLANYSQKVVKDQKTCM